jgi:hypothetical protein
MNLGAKLAAPSGHVGPQRGDLGAGLGAELRHLGSERCAERR